MRIENVKTNWDWQLFEKYCLRAASLGRLAIKDAKIPPTKDLNRLKQFSTLIMQAQEGLAKLPHRPPGRPKKIASYPSSIKPNQNSIYFCCTALSEKKPPELNNFIDFAYCAHSVLVGDDPAKAFKIFIPEKRGAKKISLHGNYLLDEIEIASLVIDELENNSASKQAAFEKVSGEFFLSPETVQKKYLTALSRTSHTSVYAQHQEILQLSNLKTGALSYG